MKNSTVILLAVAILLFASIACKGGSGGDLEDTQTAGGQAIQSQAVESNIAYDAYMFFFHDVVCADPTNTMTQCD